MYPSTVYQSRPTSDDPRETEAWALTEAARRLVQASRQPEDVAALQTALRLNQRLWTIFQVSVADDACPLPADLRSNILRLSLVVDRETVARLADQDTSKLDLLVEINRSVAGGLSGASAAAQAPTVQAAGPVQQAASPQSPAAHDPQINTGIRVSA